GDGKAIPPETPRGRLPDTAGAAGDHRNAFSRHGIPPNCALSTLGRTLDQRRSQIKGRLVGWVKRSADPTLSCAPLCVGSSLTLGATYGRSVRRIRRSCKTASAARHCGNACPTQGGTHEQ